MRRTLGRSLGTRVSVALRTTPCLPYVLVPVSYQILVRAILLKPTAVWHTATRKAPARGVHTRCYCSTRVRASAGCCFLPRRPHAHGQRAPVRIGATNGLATKPSARRAVQPTAASGHHHHRPQTLASVDRAVSSKGSNTWTTTSHAPRGAIAQSPWCLPPDGR